MLGPLAGGRDYSHRSSRPRERLAPVSRRGELADHLRAKLSIERGDGEERLVTLDGVVVGRLHPDGEERWRLVWRVGWRATPTKLNSDEIEYAETWAIEEIAALLAMERQAIEEGKP